MKDKSEKDDEKLVQLISDQGENQDQEDQIPLKEGSENHKSELEENQSIDGKKKWCVNWKRDRIKIAGGIALILLLIVVILAVALTRGGDPIPDPDPGPEPVVVVAPNAPDSLTRDDTLTNQT